MEDNERMVMARVQHEASVALATLQLHTGKDFCQVAPRFLGHAR